jgi:hypothetical protein
MIHIMAKKPDKRSRGRPRIDTPLGERVLVRFDDITRKALDEYVRRTGVGADSTAVRMIVIEKLRAEGLL